jgi:hypothetical protein
VFREVLNHVTVIVTVHERCCTCRRPCPHCLNDPHLPHTTPPPLRLRNTQHQRHMSYAGQHTPHVPRRTTGCIDCAAAVARGMSAAAVALLQHSVQRTAWDQNDNCTLDASTAVSPVHSERMLSRSKTFTVLKCFDNTLAVDSPAMPLPNTTATPPGAACASATAWVSMRG